MAYTAPNFVNGGPPALNAENLNAMAQGIVEAQAMAPNLVANHNNDVDAHPAIRAMITPITIDQANIEAGSASTEPEGSLHFIYS